MTPTRAALLERAGLAAHAALPLGALAPTPIFDTYQAVMTSRIVMAAARTGVFEALEDGPKAPADVARQAGIRDGGAELLLEALTSLRYVRPASGGRYALTRGSRRWLGTNALGRFAGEFVYDSWDHFSRLEDVLTGGPPEGLHDRAADDPYWSRYQLGMHALGRLSAPAVARAIRARSPRRLLDVGGGPGTHAIAMCRRHPGLEATVVELAPAAELGSEIVALEGLGDRIRYRVGDALECDLGSGHDVVTIHNVLHNLEPEHCRELVGRARAAAADGGTIALLEVERPPAGRNGPRIATALGVMFWLLQHTRTYTVAEIAGWMREAGCRRIKVKRPAALPGSALLLARC